MTELNTGEVQMDLGLDYPEIRDSIRKICEGFPGAYWRDLEERVAYPTEFVHALTEAGYLALQKFYMDPILYPM